MKHLPNVLSVFRIAGSIGLLRHTAVAGNGDSFMALDLGRDNRIHQDCEPDISLGCL